MMKTVCLFAGYDKNGIIDDYVIYYIKKLSEFADVYYYGDFDAKVGELKKIEKYVKESYAKRHGKYDYGSWGELIKKIGWKNIQNYDQLILANDSCYGPLYPFEEVFSYMNKKKCDFWGLSCGKGYHIHLQSYFLVFRKPVLQTDYIKDFLSKVKKQPSLKEVCELYEDQFTFYLKKNGFSYDSYIPYGEFKLHPYYETWNCIREKRFPLLKVKVFDGVVGYDSVKSWKKFINQSTDYNANMILDNLHNRGYKDKDIDAAIFHWQKDSNKKVIQSKVRSLPRKVAKKVVSPFWDRYMNRFDHRFLENRRLLENSIEDLKTQMKSIEKKIEFNRSVIKNTQKDDLVTFFNKYGMISPMELYIKYEKKSNMLAPVDTDILSDNHVIEFGKINRFMKLFKNIPMFIKNDKINTLICGNVDESIVMNYVISDNNVTLLNNNSIKDGTIESVILSEQMYNAQLLSDFCIYKKDKKKMIYDLVLINQLNNDIKSGELLTLLFNLSKNMIDESILILSIPHNSKVMLEFDEILKEVEMYWNHEYQQLLENCFMDMDSTNCLVLMKKK